MTRAIVDASVLISALITRRDTPPSQVLRAWARARFELVVSPKLISEVADALAEAVGSAIPGIAGPTRLLRRG